MTAPLHRLIPIDFEKRSTEHRTDRTSGIDLTPHRMVHMLARTHGPTGIRAKDLMSHALAVVRASSRVRAAVEILQTLDIRCVPVVDDEGVLVGLLSDRELRTLRIPYFIGNEYIGDLQKALNVEVRRLLGDNAVFVDEGASATEALAQMIHHRVAVLPVIDARGVLVGVINYLDMLQGLPRESEAVEDTG